MKYRLFGKSMDIILASMFEFFIYGENCIEIYYLVKMNKL